MDKIALNDLTALYICLSKNWSSLERRSLFDASFLRNCGGNPVILCYKNTRIDLEAEAEDIERIYIKREKLKLNRIFSYFKKIRCLLKQKRYDIIHCYHLPEFWINSICMKSFMSIPLLFTFNQNLKVVYYGALSKWLLKRADSILTLSSEVNDVVKDSFAINPLKIKTIGCGLDLVVQKREVLAEKLIACVINNEEQLSRLKMVIQVCGFLNTHNTAFGEKLNFCIFLGPRIFQKESTKKVLAGLSHDFYKYHIMTYELESEFEKLKKVDLLIGLSFEEPLDEFEIRSLVHNIPVLFPRTVARQSLLFRYGKIGESYIDGDIREVTAKLLKILTSYSSYLDALESSNEDILSVHGVETYSDKFRWIYESSIAKRRRYLARRHFLSRKA